jgi:hypothetical protein
VLGADWLGGLLFFFSFLQGGMVFALFFFAVDTLDLEIGFAWVYVMQGVGLRVLFPPRAGYGAKMWMSCQLSSQVLCDIHGNLVAPHCSRSRAPEDSDTYRR